jgi:hypothetical protein
MGAYHILGAALEKATSPFVHRPPQWDARQQDIQGLYGKNAGNLAGVLALSAQLQTATP